MLRVIALRSEADSFLTRGRKLAKQSTEAVVGGIDRALKRGPTDLWIGVSEQPVSD